MSTKPITLLTSATAGAALYSALPAWCAVIVALAAVTLTATQVIVTQVICLRASNKITTSAHALRLLEAHNNTRACDK
ncbi:hypothetical protein DL990_13615 [Amycolatopsis sp. WAC 01416]|uniref:hypothetical protein n=1 Tax=Amycolatopsis sp. WAC 01416 TaxID=2203196 RepID=UPI000F76EB2F|nr:hypothetical protein [Amycolatopsis sp. WAC 01416]RSN34669.1 hypothetical protein DL990_13615 [Amycolatopsis sp. WAC 01416]